MLPYYVAFYLPRAPSEMVARGFHPQDARLTIASALEDLAQAMLNEGKPPPVPAKINK